MQRLKLHRRRHWHLSRQYRRLQIRQVMESKIRCRNYTSHLNHLFRPRDPDQKCQSQSRYLLPILLAHPHRHLDQI